MGEQIVAQKRGLRSFHSTEGGCFVKHPFVLCDFCKSKATDAKELNCKLHFRLPFCLRSACRANNTPALRTHALLSRIRLRASMRCGLLPQSEFGSPSTDSVQSPREWVATAHPLGKRVPQTADKPKETELNTMFNKVILIGRLGQNAEAKTAQNNKE